MNAVAAWIASVEPEAYGPLGLTPHEFAELTDREYVAMARAKAD